MKLKLLLYDDCASIVATLEVAALRAVQGQFGNAVNHLLHHVQTNPWFLLIELRHEREVFTMISAIECLILSRFS
ncbi:hypothetical protein VTH8203_03683 [Vibrio thalassae]|uniref:Uncharacterized protein n=1 Tax=Vibrio thalassae TaxID=1243014 RepID=A0A240EPV4_9VIBR|nr:hypothetical protein VTH8203_03683 [Vibrio thalassae]